MSPKVYQVPSPPAGQVHWCEQLRGRGQRLQQSVWEDMGLQVEQIVVGEGCSFGIKQWLVERWGQ